MTQWYESLFENYAQTYEKEVFTQGTSGECDFIEKELEFNKNKKILDIGCGTGRHTLELVKRGYSSAGLDLSESQINRAKEKARENHFQIEFKIHDAREPHYNNEFDMVIMLCEGGFSLMETDEMNFQILQNAVRALKSGGKFIFTALNGLFPLFHSVKDFYESNKKEGQAHCSENSFDLMTFRDFNKTVFADDDGIKKELECNERYYVPSEITWLLKSLGCKKIEIFGAKLGEYSRSDKLTTEDFEMLVIAEK